MSHVNFLLQKQLWLKYGLWLKAFFSLLLLLLFIKRFCFYNVLSNTAFIHVYKGLGLNDV